MNKLLLVLVILLAGTGIAFACNAYNENNRDSSSPAVSPSDPARLAIQCATQFNPASQWGRWHCPTTTHCDNLSYPGWSYDSILHRDGTVAVYDNTGTLVMSGSKINGRSDQLNVNFWGWDGTCYAFKNPCVGFPTCTITYSALACLNN